MKKLNFSVLVFLICSLVFHACEDQDSNVYYHDLNRPKLPEIPYNYESISDNPKFQALAAKVSNEVTSHGATLGRVLYYDRKLSRNNSVACADCHRQKAGFADNVAFSQGFEGKITLRNSQAICNTAIKTSYFWDGREKSIGSLVLKPVRDHIEMGLDNTTSLVNRVKEVDYYDNLFKNAFGDTEVTVERISSALRQFVQSIVSTNAPVENVISSGWGQIPEVPSWFTQKQIDGALVFFGKGLCISCHAASSMQFSRMADIGLETDYTGKDSGVGQLFKNSEGNFMIPSLINVSLTAPYMHDGRFATLDEVVEHYNSGIKHSKNLSWELMDFNSGKPVRLNLTKEEKEALIEFLNTFTDQEMISDEKYTDPFVR